MQRSYEKGIIDQDNLADNLSNLGIFKKKEAIREAIQAIKEK